MPDYLDEIRWELDWLLTMQMEDGPRLSQGEHTGLWGVRATGSGDGGERYFVLWSSAATADFTAVMAMAARDFQPYDPSFARPRARRGAAGQSF